MPLEIPYKIDNEDREKWAKIVTAATAADDRDRVNKHDYAVAIGAITDPVFVRIDDQDVDKVLKLAAGTVA